jgi:hypothetical protein
MIIQGNYHDYNDSADLVTLEGEKINLKKILTKRDFYKLRNAKKISRNDIRYLNRKYPELLGAWPIIVAKIAKGAVGIGKRIAEKVRSKKKSDKRKKAAKTKRAAEQKREIAIQQQQQAMIAQKQAMIAQSKKKNQVIIISAVAGIALMIVLLKKKEA